MQAVTLLRANEANMDKLTATALVQCAGWEQQAGEMVQQGKLASDWTLANARVDIGSSML